MYVIKKKMIVSGERYPGYRGSTGFLPNDLARPNPLQWICEGIYPFAGVLGGLGHVSRLAYVEQIEQSDSSWLEN
jgi:hypothetical protein